MKGAIVTAAEGDPDAARRAREMAEQLVVMHRSAERVPVPAPVSVPEVDLDWIEWDPQDLGGGVGGVNGGRRESAGPEILDWMDLAGTEVS
jgi:hypothetical protein